MSNFVYDAVALPLKAEIDPVPAGADPSIFWGAADFNAIVAPALSDLRNAVINGEMIGFAPQPSSPTPTNGSLYFLYVRNSDNHLIYSRNGTEADLGGGGISGLTPGIIPTAATPSTLMDSPWSRGWSESSAGHPETGILLIDGGSTNGNGAINIRPSSGFGCFGAGISFDNQDIDASHILWNILNASSATSYQKYFLIQDNLTPVFLISPAHNIFLGDASGDFLDGSKVTIGGNLKFTMGGKIMYTVASGSDWDGTAPTFLQDAVDRLAAWILAHGGGPLP